MPNGNRRDYHHGAKRKNVQYPVNISEEDYRNLEELRAIVAKKKGRKVSRGELLVWMYRKCYLEFDEGLPLEDFCDRQISDLNCIVSRIQGMIADIGSFKESSFEVDRDGDTSDKEE